MRDAWRALVRRSLPLILVALATAAQGPGESSGGGGAGLAQPASCLALCPLDSSLYEGSAFVTGTRAETRAEALARALRDVLVKVSGDPALRDDPRADRLTGAAGDFLSDYLYLDRMSDLPKHDEQGTRDRPFTLIARFDPVRLDPALRELGDEPWRAARPMLLPRVVITDNRGASFPLTADGDPDERHREALLAAANRYGMRFVLPPLDSAGTHAAPAGSLAVTGTLRWSDSDPGWAAAWHAGNADWGTRGVSFDEAYRVLVLGAMAIASGHQPPDGRK